MGYEQKLAKTFDSNLAWCYWSAAKSFRSLARRPIFSPLDSNFVDFIYP